MTGRISDEGAAPQEAVEGAVAELERLKETLQRAGSGEVGAGELQRAVNDYVRDHRDALTTAAVAVGEQVRSQMLAELYRLRAQLLQQRAGGKSLPHTIERAGE
jgi:hypothetical protein